MFLNQILYLRKLVIVTLMAMNIVCSLGYAVGPEYLQEDETPYIVTTKYCGAYVTWYALQYYGLSEPMKDIVEDLKLGTKNHASVYEIITVLNSYGISSRAVKLPLDKLDTIKSPFIPYLTASNQPQGHFVLIIPTDSDGAILLDQKKDPQVVNLDQYKVRDPRETGWDGTSILIDGTIIDDKKFMSNLSISFILSWFSCCIVLAVLFLLYYKKTILKRERRAK